MVSHSYFFFCKFIISFFEVDIITTSMVESSLICLYTISLRLNKWKCLKLQLGWIYSTLRKRFRVLIGYLTLQPSHYHLCFSLTFTLMSLMHYFFITVCVLITLVFIGHIMIRTHDLTAWAINSFKILSEILIFSKILIILAHFYLEFQHSFYVLGLKLPLNVASLYDCRNRLKECGDGIERGIGCEKILNKFRSKRFITIVIIWCRARAHRFYSIKFVFQ